MSKFLKIIVNIFLICAILVAAAILIPPIAGITTTIVDTEVMNTNLPMGSITYSRDIVVSAIQPGDEILKESDSETYAYVIQSAETEAGKFQAINAMDSSASAEEITLRNSVSKVILTVPYIGYVVVAMHSIEGIIIIALIVLFMIILFILSELWKKAPVEEEEGEEIEETPRERKARIKEEKALAKLEAKENRKSGKAAIADKEADETVGAVQADLAASDRRTGESEEAEKNASLSGATEETASSVSEIVQTRTEEDLPEIDTHPIDTTMVLEAAFSKTVTEEADQDTETAGAVKEEPEQKQAEEKKAEEKKREEKKAEQKKAEQKKAEQKKSDAGQDAGSRSEADGTDREDSGKQEKQVKDKEAKETTAHGQEVSDRAATAQAATDQVSTAQEAAVQEATAQAAPKQAPYSSFEEEIPKEPDRNSSAPFVPVPRLTLDEILEQARKSGAEPPVRKDSVSGVSVVDYSDLL